MGEINMRKLLCLKKYFLFGSLILSMMFMLGCSSGGSDPFANNNYDDSGESGGSLFDGAAGIGGAAGGIGAGIALSEMALPPSNADAQTKNATQIDLNWDAATGNNIDGYNIYRDGAFVKTVNGTSTSDEGLEPGTQYCYQIAAFNDLMESFKINTCAKTYFTRRWGTPSEDTGREVAVDTRGNIFVAGYTAGNMYKESEANNIFLTKFNAAGVEQWTRQLTTHSAITKFYNPSLGVAVDDGGNIYVTGNIMAGDANVRVKGSGSGYDAFLTKFDTDGNKLWTRTLDSSEDDFGTDVAVDMYGNVYMSGYTSGNLNGYHVKKGYSYDMFVAMYDSNGFFRWVNQLDLGEEEYGWGVAVDTGGHIYVSGTTGTEGAGQVRTKVPTLADMFLACYNNMGFLVWTRSLGAKNISAQGCRVAVGAGGIYVTGSEMGNLDGNTNHGKYDAFLVKYNFTGFKLWTRLIGTSGSDFGSNLAADNQGYVYVAGTMYSESTDTDDMFLAKYDSAGNDQEGMINFGSMDDNDSGLGIAFAGGYLFVTGHTLSSTFDGNSSIGYYDAFLMKYDTNLNRQ